MNNFHSLGLPDDLLHALHAMQFNCPTPIQAQTIPSALEGRDILGSAQTGTGKTGAFSIPLIAYLMTHTTKTAIVLTPTRELAVQVLQAIKTMQGKKSSFRSVLLIGGDAMFKQLTRLREKPRLIVGTPGRVNDHLERGSLRLDQTGFMVLDEMDRMLDMGFSIQLERIAKHIPDNRQTLMFSATMNKTVMKIAENYLNNALRVSVGSTSKPTDNVKQELLRTTEPEKYGLLLDQMDLYSGSMIVFVKTKFGAEKLAVKLRGHGHAADAIHGDLRQRSRDQVIKNFRSQKTRILVATDIAARGLDISHVECVVNFDLPQCPEDYIHRIGRTGRAGATGVAVNFLTPQDHIKWKNICRLLNPQKDSKDTFHDNRSHSRSSGNRFPRDRSRDNIRKKSFSRSDFNAPFKQKSSGEETSSRAFPTKASSQKDKHPRDRKSFEKRSDVNHRSERFSSPDAPRDRKSFEKRSDASHRSEKTSFPSRDRKSFEKNDTHRKAQGSSAASNGRKKSEKKFDITHKDRASSFKGTDKPLKDRKGFSPFKNKTKSGQKDETRAVKNFKKGPKRP